jgi:hypothetical protein
MCVYANRKLLDPFPAILSSYCHLLMDKSTVGCLAGAHRAAPAAAVLPDVSWYIIPKLEKTYQMNTKCSKWSQNILNVRKEFKMA